MTADPHATPDHAAKDDEPLCIYCLTDRCRLHGGTYWPEGAPDIFKGGAMFRNRRV